MTTWRYVSHQILRQSEDAYENALVGVTVVMTVARITLHRHWLWWWKTWTTEQECEVFQPPHSARWYWFQGGAEVPFELWEFCHDQMDSMHARAELEAALDHTINQRA